MLTQHILDISLDMCILFLEIATVNHLQCTCHACFYLSHDTLLRFVREWSPYIFTNVLASNHAIKLVNIVTGSFHSNLDR